MSISRIIISLCLACILVLSCATKAIAFGGLYVGGADANSFDRASPAVIGWSIGDIYSTMDLSTTQTKPSDNPFWQNVWDDK